MSLDSYNLDNEGSGFDFEDDLDTAALMEQAVEETEDQEGAEVLLTPVAVDPALITQVKAPEDEDDALEPAVTPLQEPSLTDSSVVLDSSPATPEVDVTPQPQEQQAPQYSEPEPQLAPTPEPVVASPPFHAPKAQDERSRIRRIIHIVDTYRNFPQEQKETIGLFVNQSQPVSSEEEFVQCVLNVDPILPQAMVAIMEAYLMDPVDRSFFVVGLSDTLLKALTTWLGVFTSTEFDLRASHYDLSRAIVRDMEKLDKTNVSFIEATARVLNTNPEE